MASSDPFGLIRPFQREGGDLLSSSDLVRQYQSYVGQVLGTPAGFYPWRPDFGSKLQRLRHTSNPQLLEQVARHWVVEALSRYVPGIRIRQDGVVVTTQTGDDRKTLRIEIAYDIVGVGRAVKTPISVNQSVNLVA